MKTELEQQDIQEIVTAILEKIKPLLKNNSKAREKDTIFSTEELAQYLRVQVSWVRKQVSLKTIPYFKIGKYPRFKKSEIEKWINEKNIMPIPPL